jgi:ABC-2 type transport system ATP-binding protein
MSGVAIQTRNLSKSFKSHQAVSDLQLHVPEGSIYGFLGPNGAGKTTTIKMLTGLSRPTTGSIIIHGSEVKFGKLMNRKEIGYLPDVPNFYPWMTATQFLKFVGELFSIEPKLLHARIEFLLELVGLSGVKQQIGGFSRGMKQRLGIAQAILHQPKVVFMDEPTSALDPIGRKEVMEILKKLAGHMTIFLSSHILTDIERVCDRVVIMDHGKKVLEDSIEELRRRYSNRTIIVQTEPGEPLNRLLREFSKREWVLQIKQNGQGELQLDVQDLTRAEYEIPGVLTSASAPLFKLIMQEPTLEDIFMKVVNHR